MSKVGVIGAGAWGTALAQSLASDGSEVVIWAREAELVAEINSAHSNSLFLRDAACVTHSPGDTSNRFLTNEATIA